MSIDTPPRPRPDRLEGILRTAQRLDVTERTVRNYIAAGHFPAYKVPGVRGLLLDPAEVDAAMRRLPARVARAGVAAYGPKARIIALPAQAVVVDRGER